MTTSATASAFLNTLGVNTHLGSPAYLNTTAVIADLAYIGFTNVREWAPAADNSDISQWAALASAGINFDFNISTGVDIPDFIARLNNFLQQYPGHLKYIEGPNEIWNTPEPYDGLTGMAAGDAIMHDLYAAVQADPALAGIPVVNLTTGGGTPAQTYDLLGNMQASVNLGNDHTYPEGSDPTPYDYLSVDIPWQTSVTTPNLPTVVTEAGYYTMPDGSYGVNADIQAHYTVDLVLDTELMGIKSTYLYELIDDASDPGNTDPEDHFGLFNNDGSPKPVATDLHNLTTILADPGDTASTGTGLNYTVSGLPSYGHSLQLVKASGAVDIVVWAEPNIWNEATATETTAPTSSITVNLGAAYQSVSVYDPMTGTPPVATYSATSSIQLSLGDDPLIIQVAGPTTVSSLPPSANDTVVKAGSTAAIIDASGNAWTITSGGQVAVNGVTDAATSQVTELAYVNGTIWQENTSGLWSGETKPNDSWSAGTTVSPLPTGTTVTAGPVTGSGSDTLVLAMSEDAYLGDAQCTVSVDGVQLGGTFTVTASHAAGNTETFTFGGNWAPGTHTVSVDFLNDAYGGSASLDRNLYVNSVTYDGTNTGQSLTLFGDGTQSVTVTDTTPVVVTVAAGTATVSVTVISATINATSGNHAFLISGHADTFNLSGGVETITDSGSGGNTFNLPAAGSGSAIFNAAVLTNADVFDLASALKGTAWTGSTSTLGSYVHTLQTGANTELLVSATATRHATGTLLATFDNVSTSLSTILAHAVT